VLQKYFSHPSSVSYLFRNFTHKTETLGHRKASEGGGGGGGTSKITKPPGQIIMIDQSEILSISQILFITLFFFSAHPGHCCVVDQQPVCAITVEPKTIFLIQTVIFWGFFVIE
jgi:hypothetical protein